MVDRRHNNKIYVVKKLIYGVLFIFLGCDKPAENGVVKYSGNLKDLMTGNTTSVIKLDTLSDTRNLYALGAVERLKGEILVIDSKPIIASVEKGKMVKNNSWDTNASLLVYAQVAEWHNINISRAIQDKTELEDYIKDEAKKWNINVNKPFPFIIDSKVESVKWHIIDWDKNDTTHTHQKHQNAGLRGEVVNQPMKILGFYSNQHEGVFTHRGSKTHLHFTTDDNGTAGHVDGLKLYEGAILKLPKS